MWLFILAARYSCLHVTYAATSHGFSNREIPVCLASRKDRTESYILYFKDCYTDGKPRPISFDFCECRKQVEGEKYIYNNDGIDRAVFCYNYTNNPTNTPQATKIIQPALKQPECSHYKKPKTALAVFYQLIFIA